MNFEPHSDYKPTGNQPQAIKELVEGFKAGNQFETLLGVTGSGKTFTMANVIAALNKPTLIISHNKTLAGQLYGEMTPYELYRLYGQGTTGEAIVRETPNVSTKTLQMCQPKDCDNYDTPVPPQKSS